MRECAFPLTLTREQARRLQGYVQTYRRYALAALLPCTDRNALLRVLQGMQGRLLEAMDQPVTLVQLPLSQEEMTSLRVMSNELLRLYAQEPASSAAPSWQMSPPSRSASRITRKTRQDVMKRKKKQEHRQAPVFVFTPQGVTLAQEAMALFEQALQRVQDDPVRIAFARETMVLVKGKLAAPGTSDGRSHLITFDYNEKIVLTTALHLVMGELLASPPTPQRASKLHECERMQQFALDHLEIIQGRVTQD